MDYRRQSYGVQTLLVSHCPDTINGVESKVGRRIAILLVVAAFATVLALTLWPTHVDGGVQSGFAWWVEKLEHLGIRLPFGYGLIEFMLNVALFVPPAALLSYVLRGRYIERVILTGVAVSLFVEMVQLHVLDGRTSTAQDVFANSLGAAIGAAAVTVWFIVRRSAASRSTRPLQAAAEQTIGSAE